MIAGGDAPQLVSSRTRVRIVRQVAVMVTILLLVSVGVAIPAEAANGSNSSAARDATPAVPSPDPDVPTAVIAVPTAFGTELSWRAPAESTSAPAPTDFTIVSCGPYEVGSADFKRATAALCNDEVGASSISIPARAPGERTQADIDAKKPVHLLRPDGTFETVVPCRPTATNFCVVAIGSVSATGRSRPVVVGSGGVPPKAPTALTATPTPSGDGLRLSWTAAVDAVQAHELPAFAQSYEVWRDGVLLARGLEAPEYIDAACGTARRCTDSVTTISSAGRSPAVEITALTAGTRPPAFDVPKGILAPGASVISGTTGDGATDQRPVVVTLAPSGDLVGHVKGAPLKFTPEVIDGSWSVTVPASTIAGNYVVTAAQSSFTSAPVEIGIARVAPLTATIAGSPASGVARIALGPVRISGAGTPNPPATVVAIRELWTSVPKGTGARSQSELSSWFIGAAVATKVPVRTADVNADGSWSAALATANGLGERHIIEVSQIVPGIGTSTTYLEFDLLDRSPVVRPKQSASILNRTSAISTQATAPLAPTALSATPADGSASISFTAGSNGGAAITNYQFQIGSGAWTALSPVDTTSPVTIPGLTNGTAYSIKLRAINTAGPGAASPAVTVTPRTLPSAPTAVTATAGDRTATISFTPGANGGSAITNYQYQLGAGAWTALNPVDAASPVNITGLTNGTAYSIKIRAVSAAGPGTESLPVTVTPLVPSAAPTSLVATPGDGSVSIAFVAGAAGTSAITNYQYQIGTGAWTALSPADTSSPITISGLTNGTSYSIKLRATSLLGAGNASIAVSATPRVLPAAPTGLAATAGDRTASISFTPGAAGTGAVTNYEYQVGTGAWTALNPVDASSPVTVPGLVNGTVSSIKLRAVSSYGAGAASSAVSVTSRALASAPTAMTAASANGSASISFTPGAAGTGTITNYEYRVGSGAWTALSPVDTASPITVPGLVNGNFYSIAIRAVTSYGAGASSPSVTVTPSTTPAPPTGLSAQFGDRSIAISFDQGDDGGASITNYEYQVVAGNLLTEPTWPTTWTTLSPADATSPVTIPSLVNGTSYTARLRAVNAAGRSLPSSRIVETPRVAPLAPTINSATPGDQSVTLNFTAGAAGTYPITGYVYQLKRADDPSDYTFWSSAGSLPVGSSMTIRGGFNGTTYKIRIAAVNAKFQSAPSGEITFTPRTVPSAPTSLAATLGDRSASIAFTPGSDGGAAITNYQYQIGTGTWTSFNPAITSSPVSITGLTNGTTSSIKLRALNAAGTGAESAPLSVRPGGIPAAPTALGVTSKDGAATVTFTAPASTGLPITAYTVSTTEPSPKTFTCTSLLGVPEPVCTLNGLTNGQSYSFTVTARNSAGTSPASVATSPVLIGAPRAPADLTATSGDGNVSLTWTAPETPSGMYINGYEVSVVGDPTKRCTASGALPGDDRPPACVVSGLTNGVSYSFIVRATAILATGPSGTATGGYSVATSPVEPAGLPGAPSPVSAYSMPGGAIVVWSTPSSTGGSTITGYTVTVRRTGSAPNTAAVDPLETTFGPSARMSRISGLVDGASYSIEVVARTSAGAGPAATASSFWAPVATKPLAVTAVPADRSAIVSWTEPETVPVPIQSYTITATNYYDTSEVITKTADSSPFEFGDLHNGRTYSFTVIANNDAGSSPISDASASIIPAAIPSVPTDTSIDAAPGMVSVFWQRPADDGGREIISYEVEISSNQPGRSPSTKTVVDATAWTYRNGYMYLATSWSGLVNGWDHTVRIAATNAAGTSEYVTVGTVMPRGRASAPALTALTPSNGTLTADFTPSATDGGSPILSYVVDDGAGHSCTIDAIAHPGITRCTILGLTNAQSYSFKVTAINAFGSTDSISRMSGAPTALVPGAPTGVTAVGVAHLPGSDVIFPGLIQVSWTAPSTDGGSPIIKYVVTDRWNAANTCSAWVTLSDPTPTTCAMAGFVAGYGYSFRVVAWNAVGASVASAVSDPAFAGGTPNAPDITAITGGYRSVDVGGGFITYATATATVSPGRDNGRPITGYRLRAIDQANQGVSYFTSSTASILADQLIAGHSYRLSVQAQNDFGYGDWSGLSSTIYASYPPAAATGVTAVASEGSATVSFSPPAWNGSDATYTVTVNDLTSSTSWTQAADGYSTTVNGLTNDHSYSFAITTTNFAGSGPMSSASAPVTPRLMPNAPQNISATLGDTAISVAFDAPVSRDGASITGYKVSAYNPSTRRTSTATGMSSPLRVTGLTNGAAYQITVVAVNGAVDGQSAVLGGSVTPAGTPTMTNPQVTYWDNASSVVTLIPVNLAGGTVLRYTVRVSEVSYVNASTVLTLVKTIESQSTTVNVTGLTNGTRYYIQATVTTTGGTSTLMNQAGAGITPMTTPGAPTVTGVIASGTSASVSIDGPADNGGSAITGYTVTATSATDPNHTRTASGSGSPVTVSGLTAGDSYSFTAIATNATGAGWQARGGVGPASSAVTAAPSAPTAVVASDGDASTQVSWIAPTSKFGEVVTSYRATASPGGASCESTVLLNCLITGLSNYTPYTITVSARNAGGSASSSTVVVTPKPVSVASTVPSAPRSVMVDPSSGSLVVTWNMPLDDGGGAIRSFTATASPGGANCTSQALTTCAISGVDPYALYTVSVTATNSVGTSSSASSVEVSRCGLPTSLFVSASGCDSINAAARSVRAEFVDGGVKVSWNPQYRLTSTATAAPWGASCSAAYWTAPRNSDGTVYCVISGDFDPATAFHVSSGDWPPDSSGSVHAKRTTLTVPANTRDIAPHATGTVSTGASLTVVASPASCSNPLSCESSTRFPATVTGGVYDVAMTGLAEGTYNVFVVDPDPTATLGLTRARSMTVDRTQPVLDVNASSAGVRTVYGQTATIFGSAECAASTTFGIDWYVGSAISGSPFATTNPTRSADGVGTVCSFTSSVSGVADGDLLAVVSMTDIAGNTSTVQMGVVVDTVAPTISVSSPTAGATVPEGVFVVRGSAPIGANNLETVTLQGTFLSESFERDIPVADDGSFTDSVILGAGSWNLSFLRSDLAGNVSSVVRLFTVAEVPEVVRIDLPVDGSAAEGATRVLGWAMPGSTVSLSSDSNDLGSTTASADGSWSSTVTLPSGTSKIVASVGEVSDVAAVSEGPRSSTVTIASPGVGGVTNGRALFGTGPAQSDITVAIDASQSVVRTDSFGVWSLSLDGLSEGVHLLSATGTGASTSLTITIERAPPTLAITSPTSSHTHDPVITITSPDAAGDSATIELGFYTGTDLTADPIFTDRVPVVDGSAVGTLPGQITDGQWTILARRQDAAGNVGTSQVTFDYDTLAPSPSTNLRPAMVGPLAITGIGGTGAGDLPVEIDLDSQTWTAPMTGAFSYLPSPAITSGRHVVVVRQADTAGNVETATYEITVDSVAPQLTLDVLTPAGRSAATIIGQARGADGGVTVVSTPDDLVVNTGSTSSFTPDVNSYYSGTLSLTPGWWTIVITRTDAAGNVATITRRYLSVDVAPDLEIDTPNDSTRNGRVSVAGTTSNESWRSPTVHVVITPSGSTTPVFTADPTVVSGSYSVVTSLLPEGEYLLTVSREDSRFPATRTRNFSVDTIAPALSFDASVEGSINRVCGTAGTAAGDWASVGIAWSVGTSTTTAISRTVIPVGGRFCVAPPWSGLWTARATQFDWTGSITVERSANFDVVSPAPTVVETSVSIDAAADAPWAGQLTGTGGTSAGDAGQVTINLTLDRSSERPYGSWDRLRYCHETLEFVDGVRLCARSFTAPVAADGTWALDLTDLDQGFWHVVSVVQTDAVGNIGSFSTADSSLNLAELTGSKFLVNRHRLRIDHAPAPTPLLGQASNGATMSVCGTNWPYAYTARLLIYRGWTTENPVAVVPMPRASICAPTPTLLLKQNRPGSLPIALPNGNYTLVGESSDPMGHVTRSAPMSYRSAWVVPGVTMSVAAGLDRAQDAGGPISTFGQSVALSGTAAYNEVDPASVHVTVTQNAGDTSYRSLLSTVSEMFVSDVPVRSDGTWSLQLPSTFPIGSFTANVTQGTGTAPGVKFEVGGASPAVDSVVVRGAQQPNGSIVKTITISGSAPTDRVLDSTTVTLCGVVTVTNGRWTCSVTGDYADGPAKFTVTSRTSVAYSSATVTPVWDGQLRYDVAFSRTTGLQSSASLFTTVLRSQLPKPTVVTPAPTTTTPIVGAVTISGVAATANGAIPSVRINVYSGRTVSGSPAQTVVVPASGTPSTYTSSVNLIDGEWTIQTVQSDNNGNTGVSDPVIVLVDATGPDLSVSMPTSGARVRKPFLTGSLTGSVFHVGPVRPVGWLLLGGNVYEGSISYFSGATATGTPALVRAINTDPISRDGWGTNRYTYDDKWSDTPPLANGTWTAKVSARDAAGNVSQRIVTFIVDPTATPALTPSISATIGDAYTPLVGSPSTPAVWSSLRATVSTGFDPGRAPAISGGTVTFYDGDSVLGTAPVVNGTASLRRLWNKVATGYQIRVAYSGDDSYAGVTTTAVPLTAVAPAPVTVRLEPKFAGGAASGGRFIMTVARPIVQEDGSTADSACIDGGTVTLTDGAGRELTRQSLSELPRPNDLRYNPVTGILERVATTLQTGFITTAGGPQRITLATTGGRDCGPSSTTFDVDVPAVPVTDPSVEVSSSRDGAFVVGEEVAVTLTLTGSDPTGLPASILDSNGTVLAGSASFVSTSSWVHPPSGYPQCRWLGGCNPPPYYQQSSAVTLRFNAPRTGALTLRAVVGGASSGYATVTKSFSVAVEPDAIRLAVSNTPTKPGEDSVVSLVVGGPALSGQIAIDGANTSTETLSPTLTCTPASCSATSALPSALKPFGTDGTLRARFISSVTGRTYEVTRPLQRTLWQPTVTIAAGPGAPVGPAAIAAGSGTARISWTAPSANGSTITGYKVVASPGGSMCTTTTATTCSISGLTNGTEYSFEVVANSDLGASASAVAWMTPTAAITPPAPAAAAALPSSTVVRDRLVPVRSVLTFPALMDSSYRSGGTLTLTSSPDPTVCAAGSRDDSVLAYCSQTSHVVTVSLAGASPTDSLTVNGVARDLISAASLRTAGVTVADLTAWTSASWVGNTLTVSTRLYVGGTGFVMSANFVPSSAANVMPATTRTTDSPTDVRVTGAGAPATKISVASAKITGGWYGPVASNPSPFYPTVTDFSGWDVRNPRVGETAFVKATLDPIFSVPNDNNVPANLAESMPGAAPLFVQSDHGNRFSDDRMTTSATPALLGGRDTWNPYYEQNALSGLPSCSRCHIWTIRNLESTTPVPSGGALPVGSWPLGLVTYAPGTGNVTAGAANELAARTGISTFVLDVEPWATTQSVQVSLTSRSINVITAARWQGMPAEVQAPYSNVMVTIYLRHDGTDRAIAICFYNGICLDDDGNGTQFLPATVTTIGARLAIVLPTDTLGFTLTAEQDSISVVTSAPWGVSADSGTMSLNAPTIVSQSTGGASVAVTAKSAGVTLENQPSLSSPVPLFGNFGWEIADARAAFAEFGFDLFMSIFHNATVARIFMSITEVTLNFMPGYAWLNAATCGGWACAAQNVGATVAGFALKGLSAGVSGLAKGWKAAKSALGIVDTPSRIGMFIARGTVAVNRTLLRLERAVPMRIRMAMSGESTALGTVASSYGKAYGKKAAKAIADELVSDQVTDRITKPVIGLLGLERTASMSPAPVNLRTWRGDPRDPGFIQIPQMTTDYSDAILGLESSSDEAVLSAWQGAIQRAYDKAANQTAPVTDIGYGTGIGYRLNQFFAAVASISLPNLSGLDRAASTVWIGAGDNEFGHCDLNGNCLMQAGVSAIIVDGSVLVSGLIPGWESGGNYTVSVRVHTVARSGGATNDYVGSSTFAEQGSLYACRSILDEMDAVVRSNGGYNRESYFGEFSVKYTADGRWYTFGDGKGALGRLVSSNLRATQQRLCESIEAMWSHLHGGMYPKLPAPQYVAPFDPSKQLSPQTLSLIGGF